MKRILFVDDDPRILDGLRRLFHPLRAEWQTSFATGGLQALDLMAQDKMDVVVTDIRMPGMDGTELLSQVRERHPHAIRIVLSGQSDRDLTLKSAAAAHQYLSKPCDANTLLLTIARGSALKSLLTDPSLQALVASVKSLPSVPALYTKLLEQLDSPDSCLDDVANIVASDTAMTAKILQLANSAFFGIRRRIVTPEDAVLYLGFDTVKALALSVKIFSRFSGSGCPRFSVSSLVHHSVLTGALARKLAKAIDLPEQGVEDSFMAGLLHDVGKLLLVDALPKKYDQAMRMTETAGTSCWEAEQAVFGTSHAEVGTYLLWLWGLPDGVVEAIAYHHAPSQCPAQQASPLTAVYVANILMNACGGEGGPVEPPDFDRSYVKSLGLPENLQAWGTLGGEALQKQETR
jgi:putative nucleotidyltransferase with HDIG domain